MVVEYFYKALRKQVKGNIGRAILVTKILENYNVPEEKITVIYNGVDLKTFSPNLKARREIRERYHIKENEILLMFCGANFKGKGLKYIIEALPKVDSNVKLFVVGRDRKGNEGFYKELADDLGVLNKIIFTGEIKKNINDYYVASDIFVFPARHEAFGLVVIEAMASGLPVITSESIGVAEMIKNDYDGLLLNDPTDSNEISRKIDLLIEDKNLRRKIGENARKSAEKYSWEEIARRTLEVYYGVTK